jgi:Tfp pilus assembly protein PilX
MFQKRHLVKTAKKLFKDISKQYLTAFKKLIIWLLRTLFQTKKRTRATNAGFVLPTVAMVALVVVLLTTAILFRSFDRSKNASNVRVNEAVLNAAAPAIDRAKAKLNKLMSDSRLARATPTDAALESVFNTYINEYTLGDETQLKLTSGSSNLRSAWRYPVDTDNNGLLDSYTLYGIYYKNPSVSGGVYTRSRNALEARTPPMTSGGAGDACKDTNGTSATLVGNSGWVKIGSKLKKAFFVYTANVPITKTGTLPTGYERYKGNKGFSAIEYQQERVQLPLVNNAVVYEDDLELTPGSSFKLNGRIVTNSNFLTGAKTLPGAASEKSVQLYQISSPDSCFYEAENAKIIVGGNLGAGAFNSSTDRETGTVLHLYNGEASPPASRVTVNNANDTKTHKSVTEAPNLIAYNSLAYAQRINLLVDAQMAKAITNDPQEVKQGITDKKTKLGLSSPSTYTQSDPIRRQQVELYFKRRTRRVPYAETDVLGSYTTSNVLQTLDGSGTSNPEALRPPNEWIYPFLSSDGTSKSSGSIIYSNLTLSITDNKLKPSATEPTRLEKVLQGNEQKVGDRVLVGNNLPELWWNGTKFVGPNKEDTQNLSSTYWDDPNNSDANNIRYRHSQIQQLADLGSTERNGEWELAAAQVPSTTQEAVGGLRVVTGAGIFLPKDYTPAGKTGDTDFAIAGAKTEILNTWSDLMPVPSAATRTFTPYPFYDPLLTYTLPQPSEFQPYLKMRATAVYHYKDDPTNYSATNPKPIACVSSYYDPTNSTTAQSLSNNGVVYAVPTDFDASLTTYRPVLDYQAKLKYTNDANVRWVNEPLKNALYKIDNSQTLYLSDRSAIHSAICALGILDGTLSVQSTPKIPPGAIKEITFLDAREIKAIDTTTGSTNYDLAKKNRQPLEIRATVLDMNLLRATTIGPAGQGSAQEYLLPNSGIIYATRDDALADMSDSSSTISPVF